LLTYDNPIIAQKYAPGHPHKGVEMKKAILLFILIVFIQVAYSQRSWSTIFSKNEIVLIGEQTHGVQSFYEEKQKIIKQIGSESPQELLLLIESPFVLSVVRELEKGQSDYHYHHTNTAQNIEFFNKYKNYGIDLQEDCRFTEFSDFLIRRKYCDQFDRDILVMDSILSLCIIGDHYIKDVLTEAEVGKLKTSILKLESRVLPKVLDENESWLLGLCFENRLRLADYLQLTTGNGYQQRIQYRDSIMAVNVKKMVDTNKDYLAIVWAANLHIGGKGIMGKKWTKEGVKSMCEHLVQDYSVYTIAIDSKRRRKDEIYFHETILTGSKNLIDPRYLDLNCN
jgi:hypothetical protein